MSTPESNELTFSEALRDAIREEMARDESVILLGEDVAEAGGIFKVFDGLLAQFGPERVFDMPISEAVTVGAGVGAAMTGLRPIVDVMFCDFLPLAADQIVNQASKLRYMTGGQVSIPLVVHSSIGAGRASAAQHSQSLHAWFAHIPGLKVVVAASPTDGKGLMKSAIRDDNPVMFFEDRSMYSMKEPVPVKEYLIPFGQGKIKREGDDMTIVALGGMVPKALEAASILEASGISAEVIDPRTLKPLDEELILESVKRTSRAAVVDGGYFSFGATSEIAAIIAEKAFDWLDAPVLRFGAKDVPIPFSPVLESETLPSSELIATKIQTLFQ